MLQIHGDDDVLCATVHVDVLILGQIVDVCTLS